MIKGLKKALSVISIVFIYVLIMDSMVYGETDTVDLDKEYVFDDAELISELDEEALNLRCQETSRQLEIDIMVATTYDTNGRSAGSYAEDLIIDKDLGYEEDGRTEKSCVLFLVDLDNSETYIATSGLGILCVEDDDIEQILDQVYNYIRSDYYMACLAYVDKTADRIEHNLHAYANEYVDEWKNNKYDYKTFEKKYVNVEHNMFYRLRNPVVCLVISAIIASVSVILMAYNNKAGMTANGNTYMDRNEFRIHLKEDRFMNTTTTKHRISSSSGGGGSHRGRRGGSHHSGRSGRSFGGGGRKL